MRRILLVCALPMILSAQALAHALWAQTRLPDGYLVYYGEVDENAGDTLKGWQNQDLEIWSAEKLPISTRVLATHVEVKTSASELRFAYRNAPVHGEGAEAGRAVFFARVVPMGAVTRDTVQLPLDLRTNAQGQAVLLKQGKPLADWDYSCRAGNAKATEAKTDSRGHLQLPVSAGNETVCAAWIEMDQGGVWQGKPYRKTWYVVALTIVKKGGP